MKHVLNIVKKELDKIFHNPRLIFSTFILPGLLIFAIYSFMGSSFGRQNNLNLTHEYNVVVVGNASPNLDNILNNLFYDENNKYSIKLEYKNDINLDDVKSQALNSIKEEESDLWIVIDDKFDKVIAKEEIGSTNIKIITHSSNSYSSYIYGIIYQQLNAIQTSLNGPGDYVITQEIVELSSTEEQGASMLAMIAPMLIMTLIFAGALSIGADSIAGEKERGTIATILMAPISKNEIVIGKIISTIIITIISALCSFIGLMLALMQLTNAVGDGMSISFNMAIGSGIQLFALILLISLIAVSLFLIASTFAKSTKEATMYAMPVYIIGIISGVFTMFETSLPSNLLSFIIPIYNLTLGLKGCFMNQLTTVNFLIILGSNVVYFVIILFIVRKMFDSEKIMFAR